MGTDEIGYWLNTSALQLLVADAESWEATAREWERAYDDISDKYKRYLEASKRQISDLRDEIERERAIYERKVKAASRKPGIGVYAGYGIGGWSAGVGIVWRVL